MKTRIFSLLVALLSLSIYSGKAQSQLDLLTPKALYDTIAHMDSVLFNAFNNHTSANLELIKTLFTKDLEFYHDKGGLADYEQNMKSFAETFTRSGDLKRELIVGTLEVYPIPNYGAMQIGQHRFCHTENGKPDCGTFKFVHIWKYENGQWKISRVVSYGH